MRDQYETIRRLGGNVVAISSSTVDEVRASTHARSMPFTLFADSELRVIELCRLVHYDEAEQRSVARPAIFIATQDDVIRFAHVGDHSRDRPAIGSILLALERLRDGPL